MYDDVGMVTLDNLRARVIVDKENASSDCTGVTNGWMIWYPAASLMYCGPKSLATKYGEPWAPRVLAPVCQVLFNGAVPLMASVRGTKSSWA